MSDIPKYLLTGIRNATRAFEQDNPAALATVSEHLQPLVDAAMRYANRKAEQEVAGLRAQLAALTDPSPEAQLRRYREARELVENPPKIAYEWTTFYILGRRMWVRFPVGAIEPVAHVRTGPNEDAEKATEDARLTAAGWQLCGAIDAPAVPVQVGDTK